MRRRLTPAITLTALTAGAVGWMAAARYRTDRMRRRPAGAEPLEIATDVFCLGPRGRSQTNVYFVRDGGSWALVDAGWEQDAPRIEAAARALLGADSVPLAILLTHAHPDHAGSARALADAWRCPILLHPAEVEIACGDLAAIERFAGPLDRWVILPAMRAIGQRRRAAALARGSLTGLVRELGPDGRIPGLDGWTWIPTAGHTPGHVSFHRAADHVVLSGDALLNLRVNDPRGILLGRQGLSAPPWYTTWNGEAATASIAAIAALEPEVLGGGHGRPLTGPGTAAAIKAFTAALDGPRA